MLPEVVRSKASGKSTDAENDNGNELSDFDTAHDTTDEERLETSCEMERQIKKERKEPDHRSVQKSPSLSAFSGSSLDVPSPRSDCDVDRAPSPPSNDPNSKAISCQ